MRAELVHADRTRDEQREAAGDVEPAPRGDVEHGEEDPVVEERRPEVVRHHQHEHRPAPDHEQRPEILEPALRQHLSLLAQVAGEEDDQEDLRDLAGLELERSDVHPEPRPVDVLAEAGQRRQEQEPDRAEPEQVLVVFEHAVVAP